MDKNTIIWHQTKNGFSWGGGWSHVIYAYQKSSAKSPAKLRGFNNCINMASLAQKGEN